MPAASSYLFEAPVSEFIGLSKSHELAGILQTNFLAKFGRNPSSQEVTSWNNSLAALGTVLEEAKLRDAHIIFLELQMPLSSARCDVLLVGREQGQPDDNNTPGKSNAIVIELKQWEHVAPSAIRDSVAVGNKNLSHPSAQARSYANYLKYYHEAFTGEQIGQALQISGCSYLHNMTEAKSIRILKDPAMFGTLPREYPVFSGLAEDRQKFKNYLAEKVGGGEGQQLAEAIIKGGIKPSTKLLDVVAHAVEHNFEWNLLEEQLQVFNTIVSLVEAARQTSEKYVVVVRGGPGTGKSVLAIQLLAYAARQHWKVGHATGTKAFQTVLQGKTEHFADQYLKNIFNVKYKSHLPIKELFTTFAKVAELGARKENELDLVIGDEAHRLWDFRRNKYSNINRKLSETPMIEELVKASRVTALFLDDNQAVRADEIGSVEYILEHTKRLGIKCELVDLNVQFRCSGSQSYMDWVDYALGFPVEGRSNFMAWKEYDEYDFRIMDSMQQMQHELDRLKEQQHRCRFVAGFCWKWSEIQGNGGLVHDIKDPRFGGWSAPWIEKGDQYAAPLDSRYYKWATDEDYYSQVGSIYSVQGFEFDYIGLIVGEDLIWRGSTEGKQKDQLSSSKDWKAELSKNKDANFTRDLKSSGADPVEKLRNIYRVLLTRGMRGTFVYFLDAQTRRYFEALIEHEQTLLKRNNKFSA
jgi:DUF2075 family protein